MFAKIYLITLPILLGIDILWLAVVAKNFYLKQLGHLFGKNPNLLAALIFYLIFVAGLVFFVISPAVEKKSAAQALLTGALLGLVAYAAYDLTNLATIKDWPLLVTLVDLIWGATLSASVSLAAYFIASKLGL